MDVTTLMLADDAASSGGKLYIHGGGWDTVYAAELPTTVARVALIVGLRLEYHEAQEDHPIVVDLVDADLQAHGDIRIEGNLRVGHSPAQEPGDPILTSEVLRFEQLVFSERGLYTFRVFVDDTLAVPLASLSFRVARTGR